MKKIDYINERTFEKTTHDYPDFQVETIEKIVQAIGVDAYNWPLLASEDGKKLTAIAIDMTVEKSLRETGIGKYRITIKPLV